MTSAQLALACMLAPLAGFAVTLVAFRNKHAIASALVILSGLVSVVTAVMLLARGVPAHADITAHWFTIAGVDIRFGALLDGRTLLMGAVVGVVTFCVQVYSLSYMGHDPGRGRFFAFLAMFEWAMLSFVYSPSLLQTFIFWELVGLASFLLIGFWYQKPEAVAAAKKAFLMTRIGDVGLFIGLILLFQAAGTLDITRLDGHGIDSARLELIAALLFLGIIGKSAQFPLHTWLPDAMEGPTPVSALLHSATMVAAGVFLFARFDELFMRAEHVRTAVVAIATFTAILASTMAMVAKDMKRVLAFSSISQLGFMLMGLGAGSLFAGVFHLTTHAAFKALLFLCAGAYIHRYDTNDMIAMGRAGARSMRITTAGLIVGGTALAGIPPLAGFFSKESIVFQLEESGERLFWAGALLATFLTAYYTFRMIFLITRPDPGSGAQPDQPAGGGDHHGPAEPWQMAAPIIVLTIAAIGLGFFGDRIAGLLGIAEVPHPEVADMAPAVGIALFGAILAWLEFGRRGAAQTGFVSRAPAVAELFANRWYIDVFYRKVFVGLAVGVARLMYGVETRGLDRGGDALASSTIESGGVVARLQTGRLQVYVGLAVVLVGLACIFLGVRR